MDLNNILEKTKNKALKDEGSRKRRKTSIATVDRPYDIDFPKGKSSSDIQNEKRTQTEHKADTNRAQIGHKPNTKLNTNRAQIGHKPNTKKNSKIETGHKPDTKPDTHSNTNWTQTEHKPDTKSSFSKLVGLQKNILIFMYESTKKTRSNITESLTLEHIALCIKCKKTSVKTSCKRLEDKLLIIRKEFKTGRGGWTRYEVTENIYSEILHLEASGKLNTNRTQTEHKPDTKADTKADTNPSSSSSINTKNTTTTRMPDEWQKIDIQPLEDIGISYIHIQQLFNSQKTSFSDVQDSIYHFAFDLKHNNKIKEIKKTPIEFFMGILKREGIYNAPSNYESPQNVALRKKLEDKKKQKEKRDALLEEYAEFEFPEWKESLTEEDINNIVPKEVHLFESGKSSLLKGFFIKNILIPKLKEENILND